VGKWGEKGNISYSPTMIQEMEAETPRVKRPRQGSVESNLNCLPVMIQI
jgi:hypothetical protein